MQTLTQTFCVQLKYKLQFVLFVETSVRFVRVVSLQKLISRIFFCRNFIFFAQQQKDENLFTLFYYSIWLFGRSVGRSFVVFCLSRKIFALNQTVRLSDFLHTEWLRLMEKSHERAV